MESSLMERHDHRMGNSPSDFLQTVSLKCGLIKKNTLRLLFMNKTNRLFLASSVAAAFAFVASPSQADLILSGSLVGVFQSSDNPNTTVANAPDGDASFRTGIAVSNSFQSGINFNSQDFSGLSSGDEISLGMFTYYNGITAIGTSSGTAMLDLYLQLTDPESSRIHLTTMTFGIDATTNTLGNLIPDNYTVNFAQPSAAWIGGEWVKFSIGGLPPVASLAENTWKNVGSLTFTSGTASPVAEGGVTGLFLVLGLAAIMGSQRSLRRAAARSSKSMAV